MSALYELTSDFTELFNRFDEINDYEPDTDADGNYIDAVGNIIDDVVKYKQDMLDMWFDTLDGIEGEFSDKAESIACMIKQYQETADAHERQERIQRAAKERCRREVERLKKYLLDNMTAINLDKVKGVRASVSLRNNPESVVVDNEGVFVEWARSHNRDDLLRFRDPDINKTAIKGALKEGQDIPARLERTRSVVIK